MIRKVVRALAAPFRAPQLFEDLGQTIEKRLKHLEYETIRPILDRQRQIDEQMAQLVQDQTRLTRAVLGEPAEEEVARAPFRGPLPLRVEGAPDGDGIDPESDCPKRTILRLVACPVCGDPTGKVVCKFNKMITSRLMPDANAAVYNYTLCSRCGVVYAARRPAGERFAWLLEHFEESLGRVELNGRRIGKLTLSSYALDDESREHLRQLASRGVFVSEHLGLTHKDYLWQLESDRLANSRHLELLGSLLDLRAPRVLEIRSRLGSILAGLRRLYGAEVFAIPMFPNQQFLINEVYGIPSEATMDFDRFSVPYEGPFDLIVANHMLTHIIRPAEYFETVRNLLMPGGHLYLYNEPAEEEFLHREKSMFNTLNAFHMQTFDRESLVRALNANGFEVIYIRGERQSFVCLARKADGPIEWTPMSEEESRRRRTAYRRAKDLAILLLPGYARGRFADEWAEALERGQEHGSVAEDERGRLRVMKRID